VLPVLAIPPITVLVVMSYWFWRIRIRRVYRGLAIAVEDRTT
jgi:hypothetical protein